ncbi:MAG: hypothetical protein ACK5PB_19675 [Pirellula sp.]|jgi:hypothetical protein
MSSYQRRIPQTPSPSGRRPDGGEEREGTFSSRTVIAPPAQGRNGGGRIILMENATFIELRALA